ncbi:MAG TPA: NAD(P)/FAD-dependent oxidoreductase [Acidimicrobiales bacterium]|nr:NAD(P)/FAD-dependent oxidoreductase [Acidimicrobiales bacterium]
MNETDEIYDVAIVGGGPAGLSAALILGRSRRSVVVVDAGQPRNAPAAAVHGFLTRDGTPPRDLLAAARAEVAAYGVRLVDGEVAGAAAGDGGFALTLAGGGGRLAARRLLVAGGLVDELPDIPGVRELWGDQVIHCPYCHGWEAREKPIGIVASGPMATHQALLFRQLSDDVVLFAHTQPPTAEQRADLAARDIRVIEGEVAALEVDGDGRLTGVRLATGETVAREVVTVAPRFVGRTHLLESLGVEATEHAGVGIRVAADPTGRTEVPGVWVAGNVTDHAAQVIVAAAAGATAGAHINADLVAEDVRRAAAAPPVGAAS